MSYTNNIDNNKFNKEKEIIVRTNITKWKPAKIKINNKII